MAIRPIVKTQVFQDWPGQDHRVGEALTRRVDQIMRPLLEAASWQNLRKLIDAAVVEYVPVKVLAGNYLVYYGASTGQEAQEIASQMNSEALDVFSLAEAGRFTSQDKRILLDVLRLQTELADLVERCPPENRPALLSAVLDSYWALQKLDLSASTALLIASGQAQPSQSQVFHWLCLACRRYLNQWQSTLFVNNPELQRRLLVPSQTIPLEEVKKRIGL